MSLKLKYCEDNNVLTLCSSGLYTPKPGDLVHIPSRTTIFNSSIDELNEFIRMKETSKPSVGVLISLNEEQVEGYLFGNYCKVLIEDKVWFIEDKNVFLHAAIKGREND